MGLSMCIFQFNRDCGQELIKGHLAGHAQDGRRLRAVSSQRVEPPKLYAVEFLNCIFYDQYVSY